jgi:hypothetical protein
MYTTFAIVTALSALFSAWAIRWTPRLLFQETLRSRIGTYLPSYSEWSSKIIKGIPGVSLERVVSFLEFATSTIVYIIRSGGTLVDPVDAHRNDGRLPRFIWPYGDTVEEMFRGRCDSLPCFLRPVLDGEEVIIGTKWIEDLNGSTLSSRRRMTVADVGSKDPPSIALSNLRAMFDDTKLLGVIIDGKLVSDGDEAFDEAKWFANMRLLEKVFMDDHLRTHIMFEDLQCHLEHSVALGNPGAKSLLRNCMQYSHSNSFVNGVALPTAFQVTKGMSGASLGADGALWHESVDLIRDNLTCSKFGSPFDTRPFLRENTPTSCTLPKILNAYAQEWVSHISGEVASDCDIDKLAKSMMKLTGFNLKFTIPSIILEKSLNPTHELVLCCYLVNIYHSIVSSHIDATQHSLKKWAFDSYPNKVASRMRADYFGLPPTGPSRAVRSEFVQTLKQLACSSGSKTFELWRPEVMASEIDR